MTAGLNVTLTVYAFQQLQNVGVFRGKPLTIHRRRSSKWGQSFKRIDVVHTNLAILKRHLPERSVLGKLLEAGL